MAISARVDSSHLWVRREELGVTCQDPEALVPLTEPHKHEVVEPSIGVCDREFVQTFAMRGYAGPVTMDPAEVRRNHGWRTRGGNGHAKRTSPDTCRWRRCVGSGSTS